MKSSVFFRLSIILLTPLLAPGCKTGGGDGSKLKEAPSDTAAASVCEPAATSWAGRMGLSLVDDGGGGPVIDCTALGTGLVHLGLHKGDRINALNFGTPVTSAQSFEDVATKLAKGMDRRIRHWEFSVVRGGETLKIKPKDAYPACGLYVFDDCGPLEQ